MFAAVVVAVAAAAATLPPLAAASEPTRTTATSGDRPPIVAFIPPIASGVLPRLRAELGVAGFDLHLADDAGGGPPSRDTMEQLARRHAAVAALAFIPAEGPNVEHGATEIWVVDRVTGKTVVRVFAPVAPGHGDEADLLAVAAVETLRATLMEISLAHPARGEVAPPPAVQALVAPPPRRFAARLGAAVGYDRGGLGSAWQLAIALTAALGPRLRLGVDGLLPLSSAGVTGTEGKADVRLWLAGPFVEVSLTDASSRCDLSLGAGVWAAALRMGGNAAAPYMGVATGVTTAAPHVDLGFRWRLGRRLAVGGAVSVAVAAHDVAVVFSGRDAAHWGRPFGLAALVVEARLD